MIIKNFLGVGVEINNQEKFRISWDYISIESGQEIAAQSFYVPDALITEEWILAWDLLADAPFFLPVQDALSNSTGILFLAWYTDTIWLEYYFTAADKIEIAPFDLQLPKAYEQELDLAPSVENGTMFRFEGKNYPGQSTTNKTTSHIFPGLKLGLGPLKQDFKQSLARSLTGHFTEEIAKQDRLIRNSWETDFGPSSGSEFSFNMFGLDRKDYRFLLNFPLLKDAVMATLPTVIGAKNYLFIGYQDGVLVRSLNTLKDFKYGPVSTPADLMLEVVENGVKASVYQATGTEGQILTYTSLKNQTQSIVLGSDRYEPEITLGFIIPSSAFVPGFKYKYLAGQPLPAGFISQTSTSGRYPATGIRPWNIKLQSFGVFNGKNTRHAVEFFFKLFKLRQGKTYNSSLNKIETSPQDFEQLLLWSLPPLIVEPASINNALVADSIIGTTTNEVCIRLPFDYKRDGTEWKLAHDICRAFLQNYTIGYHEFVADFSAADEPVFMLDEPQVALSTTYPPSVTYIYFAIPV
jgi:hypothetical protein